MLNICLTTVQSGQVSHRPVHSFFHPLIFIVLPSRHSPPPDSQYFSHSHSPPIAQISSVRAFVLLGQRAVWTPRVKCIVMNWLTAMLWGANYEISGGLTYRTNEQPSQPVEHVKGPGKSPFNWTAATGNIFAYSRICNSLLNLHFSCRRGEC